jgi:hypothetical protein
MSALNVSTRIPIERMVLGDDCVLVGHDDAYEVYGLPKGALHNLKHSLLRRLFQGRYFGKLSAHSIRIGNR